MAALRCTVLVLGSGVAGLSLALEAASFGDDVLVVTKRDLEESNTRYAQGGIAAVLDRGDSFEAHVADTLEAGAGLNHRRAVEICVEEGPERIAWLQSLGARFDPAVQDGGATLDLHLEGGHSARRIAHAADMTGREIERALAAAVAARPNIRTLPHHTAVDLIMHSKFGGPDECVGAYILDEVKGEVQTVLARAVVLATGGAGKVYLYTTNPDVTTGDGIAMAYRAGAEIANMEFTQFHPTCLYHPAARTFLISEALRGEGAVLKRPDGSRFMAEHDPRLELAPRDVVARAIDFEMKKTGADCMYLDISQRGREFIDGHFPGISSALRGFGLDLADGPVPIVPAAHYLCGGISTDLKGRTSIPGLFAIGECAHTGLHGANRLASNSLLEGLVLAHRACSALRDLPKEGDVWPDISEWDSSQAQTSDEAVIVTQNWSELRELMWNYVGIVRSDKRLRRAARRIALLQEEIVEYYWNYFITRDLLELRNIATVAELIVECASVRKESRGLHFTVDHKGLADVPKDSVKKRGVPAYLRTVTG